MLESGWKVCHSTPSLQRVLPDALASEQNAVVLSDDGEMLSIATVIPSEPDHQGSPVSASGYPAGPASPAVGVSDAAGETPLAWLEQRQRLLASALSRPVKLELASADEVELARANCRGDAASYSLRFSRLWRLVNDCGLRYVLDARADPVDGSGRPGTETVESALQGLANGWGPELLGLLEGLPHLLPQDADFEPALCVLLPPSVRARWQVEPIAPWGFEDGHIVLGCEHALDEDTIRSIVTWTGMPVRSVLCEGLELRAVLAAYASAHFGPESDARLQRRPVIETDGADMGQAPYRWTAKAQVHEYRSNATTARHSDGSVAGEERRSPLPGGESATAQSAMDAIPLPLARSLSIVPVMSDHDVLTLGIAARHPEAEAIRRAISRLTGARVRLHEMSPDRLQGAQARHYRETDAWRLQALWRGRKAADGATGARRGGATTRESGPQHTTPSVRLEYYAVKPELVQLISRNLLEALCAVPLRRDGHVLWVAMAAPSGEICRALARASGMVIRPVAAADEAIRSRLRAFAVSSRALNIYAAHPVIGFLQHQGRLVGVNLLQYLDGPEAGADQALVNAGVLDYEEFAELASRLCNLPRVNLRHTGKLDEVYFETESRVRIDLPHVPVDPAVATMVPLGMARSRGVLPIRREHVSVDVEAASVGQPSSGLQGSCIVVAVADPCAPEVHSAVASLSPAICRLTVAPRPEILAAIARSSGSAQLGERLLLSGVVSEEELERAVALHASSGVRLGQALIHLSLITQEQLAYFLAEQLDLPFVGLKGIRIDEDLARRIPEQDERRLGVLPLYEAGSILVAVMPDPLDVVAREEAETLLGLPIQPMICTEEDFEAALESLYRDLYLERSSTELAVRSPEESAARVVTRSQTVTFAAAGVVAIALLWRAPVVLGVGLAAICTLLYAAFSFYRGYLIYRSLSHDLEIPVGDDELAALDDVDLPVYTVLVPLYREAAVLPALVAGLARLDYPPTKLDVKLLLEEDDMSTRGAVAAMQLPAFVHPVVVPAAHPRGKPKACNYGLIHARGEYVVIYDAEDVPEPDQLKKAVIGFRKVPADVVCLQAKLSYYNSDQNWLTRWFSIEYSMWFDLFLPGLDASGAPVPLGGTSNHFKVSYLLEIGAWDPFNVTEDADLGVRLFRRGWRTAVIESTTYEEATSEVYNWIRQRSRWVKGYVQTYLVHMRHPVQFCREVGLKAFLSFNIVVGGTFFGLLVNPILWCLTALWYSSHAHLIRELFPAPIFYLGGLSLVLGNTAFVYLNVAGCLRPGMYDKVKFALLSPLYWALMSLAAWKGFIQLWFKPFYWEKTIHGLYRVTNHSGSTSPLTAPATSAQQVEVA